MKAKNITPSSGRCGVGPCPSVFETDDNSFIVIGAVTTIDKLPRNVLKKIGKGETAVVMPRKTLAKTLQTKAWFEFKDGVLELKNLKGEAILFVKQDVENKESEAFEVTATEPNKVHSEFISTCEGFENFSIGDSRYHSAKKMTLTASSY
jgi:hypothetical protein